MLRTAGPCSVRQIQHLCTPSEVTAATPGNSVGWTAAANNQQETKHAQPAACCERSFALAFSSGGDLGAGDAPQPAGQNELRQLAAAAEKPSQFLLDPRYRRLPDAATMEDNDVSMTADELWLGMSSRTAEHGLRGL